MDASKKFSFGSESIAKAYNDVLVPTLFEPWAKSILLESGPWAGKHVLDLACGTGVVTAEMVKNVIPKGKVIALDINREMLNLARLKCAEWSNHVQFIVGSAESLDIPNDLLDKVICQQGFQFFPDKRAVAHEIYRVLKPQGMAIISTWCSVSECEIFGAICESLESLDLNDISNMMRIPFDFMSKEELLDSFAGIGFSSVKILKEEKRLHLDNDLTKALAFVYSTPIGPKLSELKISQQEEFKKGFMDKIKRLMATDGSVGKMVSYVVYIEK